MSLSRTGENHAELNRWSDYALLLLPKEERVLGRALLRDRRLFYTVTFDRAFPKLSTFLHKGKITLTRFYVKRERETFRFRRMGSQGRLKVPGCYKGTLTNSLTVFAQPPVSFPYFPCRSSHRGGRNSTFLSRFKVFRQNC